MSNAIKNMGVLIALLLLGASGSANASLILDNELNVLGTGLGAVNTLVTVHDPGGPGNQNGIESGCINQNGSFSPCLDGVQGGDNTALNQVLSLANNTSFGAVVNIAETGQDAAATLTNLYLTFHGANGTYTATYDGGPVNLVEGNGTGTGGAGFPFLLDSLEYAIVQGLGPNVTISGGVQFAYGTTNDGSETVYVIQTDTVLPPSSIPEPGTLGLLAVALAAAAGVLRLGGRRRPR